MAEDGELAEGQASPKPVKYFDPCTLEKGALARSATAPVSQSQAVVTRRTSTRPSKTINGTSDLEQIQLKRARL